MRLRLLVCLKVACMQLTYFDFDRKLDFVGSRELATGYLGQRALTNRYL